MNSQKITFVSDGLKLVGNIATPNSEGKFPTVLFLHGAGHADKSRFIDWQNFLAEAEIASFCFDFRGCGESEGEFEDGSLDNRLVDAVNATGLLSAVKQVDPKRLVVAGNSMGAHVAVRLLEKEKDIKAILLTCAAAYGQEAESKQLNEQFSNAIRPENSWINSPVFKILEEFKGKILVSYGENDQVVPDGVKAKFRELCRNKGQYITLPGGAHALLKPETPEQEQARQLLFTNSRDFIQKYV